MVVSLASAEVHGADDGGFQMTDTQHSLEVLPNDLYATLFKFSWGSGPTVLFYARWHENIVHNGDTYTPNPYIRYIMQQGQHGGTEDSPVNIEMRMDYPPFDTLCQLTDHAPVKVRVIECSPLTPENFLPVFEGKIASIKVKARRKMLATAKVVSVKRLLKTKAGLQALSTCPWIFGQDPCQATPETTSGTVTTLQVNGKPNRIKIQIPSPPDMDNAIWNRGYVEFDGLRIQIRRSFDDAGSDDIFRFDLRTIPPADWIGEEVTIVSGCDGTITSCRARDQEENFGGIGYATLDRNPIIYGG